MTTAQVDAIQTADLSNIAPAPEPSSLMILGGLMCGGWALRRRAKRA